MSFVALLSAPIAGYLPMTSSRRAPLATSAAKWDARYSHAVPHDALYYGKCMIGGILSCGLTHMLVFPGKYNALVQGIKLVAIEEGASALFKGWAPTAIGYSAQGFCKFGFYEIFNDFYSTLAGEENAYKYRGMIFLAGSASAEFIADVALCPMEMVKVKTGFANLATKGLGTRIIMIGTLTGLQWWIYDSFKSALGMGTAGGVAKNIGE
ncbi:hypothetical protein SDRG_08926 [Saprolegnia diclina VS20]|uniref:Uncharacterized protein n=1 Tax=Saprolegnia diclina (strain VS20) TaxID=1156394 RepID=T0QFC6_SAPDV|nr:hypothetical protein SDRG_08926 [Saprolegnia diclina VS20]EQC33411.1 hypothetical protein SDRG_08926 [Saprolegnia diclina VS20]|eukprot:XP_008613051.1 hypothetical protein SDRG_08926 [Saprolegnia diclina VS20]